MPILITVESERKQFLPTSDKARCTERVLRWPITVVVSAIKAQVYQEVTTITTKGKHLQDLRRASHRSKLTCQRRIQSSRRMLWHRSKSCVRAPKCSNQACHRMLKPRPCNSCNRWQPVACSITNYLQMVHLATSR